ncbi:MAG: CoA activase [candidate division Zixibacteria bacterium]|nr:CoA activase [candidate division Zixibacteria bacterium]MBU1470061.1 CoA activase [candidate division Zixibacteria bacterium]MBU2624381.1 CoA activase [candidate division Zixibacteria bacterium]
MITAGIDMGSKYVKVVVLKDGVIRGKAIGATGFEPVAAAEKCLEKAATDSGIEISAMDHITSTGAGRKVAPNISSDVTDVSAAARGVVHLLEGIQTIIDIGAEEGRGIKIDANGKVVDLAVNEKCAAGAGAFAEAMSRALDVSLEEFGQLSLKSDKTIPMNAQCAVFAESEVVSLVHAKTPKHDIAKAVHDAIASRIVSMVRRVGINKEVALIGGVSHNPGFVDALNRGLETQVIVPEDPDYVGALGAAIIAGERSH